MDIPYHMTLLMYSHVYVPFKITCAVLACLLLYTTNDPYHSTDVPPLIGPFKITYSIRPLLLMYPLICAVTAVYIVSTNDPKLSLCNKGIHHYVIRESKCDIGVHQ